MRAIRAILAASKLPMGFAASVSADPHEDAHAAYTRGDYNNALRLWRPLADQGDATAQASLGFMHQMGLGVPQDYAEALKWYRLAADQGLADAQVRLGLMYLNGQGVLQNYGEALEWFRLAADQGLADAQHNLGVMYDRGEGVPENYVSAHMWYNLSAAQGDQDSAHKRNLVARSMTPAQIEEALKLAREWRTNR
jgi:uncharacterized protein